MPTDPRFYKRILLRLLAAKPGRAAKLAATSGSIYAVVVVLLVAVIAVWAMVHHFGVWPFAGIELAVVAVVAWRIQRLTRARNQTRRSSEEREEYFRTILDNVGDLIVVLDSAGRPTYMSPSAQRVIGQPSEQLLRGLSCERVDPTDREYAEALVAQSLNNPGQRVEGQVRLTAADGTARLLAGSATTLERRLGGTVVVIGMQDVTEQQRLEEELIRRAMHDQLTGRGS